MKMGLGNYLVRKRECVIIAVITFHALFLTYYSSEIKFLSTKQIPPEYHEETLHDTLLERIDWNNYSLMERDSKRTGPGEQGIGAKLNLSSEQEVQRQKLLDKYKYDVYLSDHVSMERSIGDIRPEACKGVKYMKDIPENSVSIIMPMFNEKNSTLLRSIHSIINRSPASLLKEVIVVDDFSQEAELKAPLEDYIHEHFSKVRIIRNKQREGLIRSRIIGANASTGSFLVFVDSHIEVNYNYLPPLLEIMMLDYRTIACPTIDFVAPNYKINTLAQRRTRGGFNWELQYVRMPVTVLIDEITPHDTPVMVGCAFSITRKWWEELGKYDPGLNVWGAEQFELSVKSWLCGGRLVDSPCSRVAHQFRKLPYISDLIVKMVNKNLIRFATVWMDGYREAVLYRKPSWRNIDPGDDIIEQVKLRKQLKCKSFDWFLAEVAPDILEFFPVVEPPPLAWGRLISRWNSSLCAYVNVSSVYLSDCNSGQISVFVYDWRHHIVGNRNMCLNSVPDKYLIVGRYADILIKQFQSFAWDTNSGRIINYHSRLCIDLKPENLELFMNDCVDNKRSQSWEFQFFNGSRVVEAWNKFTQIIQ